MVLEESRVREPWLVNVAPASTERLALASTVPVPWFTRDPAPRSREFTSKVVPETTVVVPGPARDPEAERSPASLRLPATPRDPDSFSWPVDVDCCTVLE